MINSESHTQLAYQPEFIIVRGSPLGCFPARLSAAVGGSPLRCFPACLSAAFKADRNADGKVDAADDEVSFDLRFAVLTCGSSYSSANLLPQLFHERGVAVIGEQSGGGPCGLEYCTTADGWRFTISSNTQVKSDSWENIDGGVPVDAELVKAGDDGKRDYSGLYDLDAMSAAIASFYSK